MSTVQTTSICSTENALSSYMHSLFELPVEEQDISLVSQPADSYPDVFDVMLFQVAGITLAIEPRFITSITTTSNIDYLGQGKSHYDLSELLRPGTRITQQGEDLLYHIYIEGLEHPLLSEFVGGVVPVYSSRINWRTHSGKRKWLAGTMPALKCGLIDVSGLIAACNGIQTA